MVKHTAEDAATAAAAEVAAGALVPASAPVLCIADYGRRPLMFLSKADFDVLKEHSLQFLDILEEYRSRVKVSSLPGDGHLRIHNFSIRIFIPILYLMPVHECITNTY